MNEQSELPSLEAIEKIYADSDFVAEDAEEFGTQVRLKRNKHARYICSLLKALRIFLDMMCSEVVPRVGLGSAVVLLLDVDRSGRIGSPTTPTYDFR